MQLFLIRHAQSLANYRQVLQPAHDPLTDEGRRQARSLAVHLAGLGRYKVLYTSPLARAFETARIIGEAASLRPQPRAGLAEINVGEAAGLDLDEWMSANTHEARKFYWEGLDFVWPGGESGRQLSVRAAAAIDSIIDKHIHDERPVIVVSHGGPLSWIVAHLRSESWDEWPRHQFHNASITEVSVTAGKPKAVRFGRVNDISYLDCQQAIGARL